MERRKFGFAAILALGFAAFSLAPCAARADVTSNLLANGDAEAHRCTKDWTAETPVPGWRVLRGAASVVCYDAFNSFREMPVTPSGASGGRALFAAPGADTAMEQSVDVTPAGAAIDRGAVAYDLSAWLGGWRDRPERATLTAVFLDAEDRAAGEPVVLADVDAKARNKTTALLARAAHGVVPKGTRKIVVTVAFISGMTSFQNAYADNLILTLSGDVGGLAPARLAPPPADVPALDHVFIVMMENTNYADVVHRRGRALAIDSRMPFLASLAAEGALLSNMWATYHPSDQNYVAMVAGDTFKFGPVYYPDYDLAATHLGDLVDARGLSWRAYVQHMKKPCNLASDPSGHGSFAPDDEPFAQFKNVIGDPGRCAVLLRDLKDFSKAIAANALPAFAWIAADGWWDGEGAWYDNFDVGFSLTKQDAFLKSTFAPLLNSAAWRNSRSLLIVVWDESLGWGWPDNHVPAVVVGSPGLVRAGAVIGDDYDGYSVLRTVESALGLKSLHRFDEFARPLDVLFAGGAARSSADEELWASEAATTRGRQDDTFGQVRTPTAVVQGETLTLIGPEHPADDVFVNFEPLGHRPAKSSTQYRFDAHGTAAITTTGLAPGYYAAWLRRGSAPPARAPLPVILLPRGEVRPSAPGVEIVGAPAGDRPLEVREGANFIVRYCAAAGATEQNSWIGLFAEGAPPDQMTKQNANAVGNWLKTPGVTQPSRCGEAMAYPAELAPGVNYRVYLFRDEAGGASHIVGSSAAFTLTHTLP